MNFQFAKAYLIPAVLNGLSALWSPVREPFMRAVRIRRIVQAFRIAESQNMRLMGYGTRHPTGRARLLFLWMMSRNDFYKEITEKRVNLFLNASKPV